MTVTAYIAFGSNMGDPKENLEKTKAFISQNSDIKITRTSPLYKTEPLTKDGQSQDWYLNCVLEVETKLTVKELWKCLKKIETDMGRTAAERWAPRPADLDILLYGTLVYESPQLCVPHREIQNRRFVLTPLNDLAPHLIHPILNMSVQDMLNKTQDTLKVLPC